MARSTRVTAVAGTALVLAAWAAAGAGLVADRLELVRVLAGLAAVLAVLVAGRFHCSRVALAAVAVAASHWLLWLLFERTDGVAEAWRAGLRAFLPLDLGLLTLAGDESLLRRRPLLLLALLAAQPALFAVLLELGDKASSPWVRVLSTTEAGGLALLVGVLLAVVGLALGRGAVETSLLVVLGASALALLGPMANGRPETLLAAAQLVLLVGLVEESHRLAYHDQLTDLPDRRALQEALGSLPSGSAVAMVDVDHFKSFNDRFGHDAGDQALRMVASELAAVGGGGRAFRCGGEEFAVLFPGRSLKDAAQAVEQVREAIAARRFALRAPDRPRRKPERPRSTAARREVTVTVSAGVAAVEGRQSDPEVALRGADRALYRAKAAGRNRVARG
jgi:diguanylate cyclase (GGDEF)-like protein